MVPRRSGTSPVEAPKKKHRSKLALLVVPALAGAVLLGIEATSIGPVEVAVLRNDGGTMRIERVQAQDLESAQILVEELRQESGVVAASIPQERTTLDAPAPSNDARRSEQWALNRLEAEVNWPVATGDGVVVAVLDTGVDAEHPELRGAVLPGHDVIEDGDGGTDPNGHGTHVAGIIAAEAGNSLGVAGLAPDAQILPVRVLDSTGSGDDAGIAEGVLWAADHGADVINLSLGGPERDPVLAAAVASALDDGITVVAASGNDGTNGNPTMYPGALPGVLAVGATTFGDQRAMFSTSGDYVRISAPGLSILSTWPGGGYSYSSGTSMAAPYVSAAAALVAQEKWLRGDALVQALTTSATDAGAAGRDPVFGYGVVDPYAALRDGKPRPPRGGGDLPSPGELPDHQLPDFSRPEVDLPDLTPGELPDHQLPDQRPERPEAPRLDQPRALPAMQVDSRLTATAARKGSTVTVKGSLSADGANGSKQGRIALGRRTVQVEVLDGDWKVVKSLDTNAFGKVEVAVKVPAGKEVRLRFVGDALAKPSVSAGVRP